MRALFLRLLLGLLVAVAGSHALATLFLFQRFDAGQAEAAWGQAEIEADNVADQLRSLPPWERKSRVEDLSVPDGLIHYRLLIGDERARPGKGKKKAPPFLGGPPRRPPIRKDIGDGQTLLVHVRPGSPSWGFGLLVLQIVGVLFIVTGVGFALAWPMMRDLRALEESVTAYGKDDLDARANVADGPIAPLADGFNAMADRVQRVLLDQRQLMQAVSHELRTPNARIRFLLEALRDADDAEARERLIDSIDEDLSEVDSLITELLAYLRFDVDDVKAEAFDLPAAIQASADNIAPLHPAIAIEVDCELDTLKANRRWFVRVVDNLLTNAVRHAATRVRVRASREGRAIVVTVDDDGDGVPPDDRHRIFEAFASGDPSRSRELGGVGLGLAIVARIMNRHAGSVRVEQSRDLGGASFRTVWPGQFKNLGTWSGALKVTGTWRDITGH